MLLDDEVMVFQVQEFLIKLDVCGKPLFANPVTNIDMEIKARFTLIL